MKYLLVLILSLALGSTQCQSQNQNNMENQIRSIITHLESAAFTRDIQKVEHYLHDDYRVVANRFRGASTATILNKATYLQMMKDGKIGGTSYKVNIHDIKIADHTAAVDVLYNSPNSNMHKYLILLLDENDQWKVVSDIPVISN